MVSFSSHMTNWAVPFWYKNGPDVVTGATPLAASWFDNGSAMVSPFTFKDMLLGTTGGCIGETCALALIIGGVYLMIRKIISPAIPLSFIGTVAVIMLIAGKGDFRFVAYQLLSGGLMLGAFFMATDYTTSPINLKGRIIFGIGCGLLTSFIRLFGSLPEGVSFSIILMNILVPHIEHLTTPKPFGTVKEKKKKGAEKA